MPEKFFGTFWLMVMLQCMMLQSSSEIPGENLNKMANEQS